MKYVIYARKSSEDDKRQALSIPAQINTMQEVASRDACNVVKVFQESKSAKYPGREVFNEMILFIEQGKADAILCWKMDRLSRNPLDEGRIKYLLESGVIKMIKTPDREFDSQENSVITGIEFSMASQYSRDLSKNVKRGNREKLQRGWWPSSAPFGYLNVQGEIPIVQDPERAPLLRFAFERYALGDVSISELNEELYNRGLRTKSGKKLTKSALHHKLQNPFYYGEMVRNGENFQGKHEPIVSRELFNEVQSVRLGTNKKRGYKHFFPFRGLLTCFRCGCALTADKKKGHTYYYCTNGKGICDAHRTYMRSEVIDKQIAKKLSDLRFENDIIELAFEAKMKMLGQTVITDKQNKERLRLALQRCTEAQDKLMRDHDAKKVPEIIYERKIKELAQEQENLEKQIAKKISIDSTTFEPTKDVFLKGNSAQKDFKRACVVRKKEVLNNLLSNITFDGQKIAQIQYKKGYQLIANTPKNVSFDAVLGR